LSKQPVPETFDLSVVEQAIPSSPIWPCSRWGFPCLRDYSWSGGLLLHLFTLASAPKRGGGLFSVALSVNPALPGLPERIRPFGWLRGIAPYGVRTFLPELALEAILHPSKTEPTLYPISEFLQ